MPLCVVALGTAVSLLLAAWFPQWRWEYIPAHAVLEAIGSFSGIALFFFLALSGAEEAYIGLAFLIMGLLDLFHAASLPGHGFIRLHLLAGVLGGFFAVLPAAARWGPISEGGRRRAVLTTACLCCVFGVALINWHELLPAALADGKYTPFTVVSSLCAGLLFLWASVRLAADMGGEAVMAREISLIFAALSASYLPFVASRLWEAGWWFQHLVRVAAFAGVCIFMLRRHLAALAGRDAAEAGLRESNAGLERRVEERTAQLQEANKELEAFAYSVSHDLRAPLRHIAGFVELLGPECAGRSPSAARYLGIISDSAKQMGALIDDLLSFSRLGRAEMRDHEVDLTALAKEAAAEAAEEARGRDLEWKLAALPKARGDASLLRQVFLNLFQNSVKYTRPKAGARVELRCLKREGEWEFSVSDNGVGFDPKYGHKLFGVFQRLHSAEEFEGTGIGLALVRRIVARHGGRTWAEGEPGKGAVFYFTLPRIKTTDGGAS